MQRGIEFIIWIVEGNVLMRKKFIYVVITCLIVKNFIFTSLIWSADMEAPGSANKGKIKMLQKRLSQVLKESSEREDFLKNKIKKLEQKCAEEKESQSDLQNLRQSHREEVKALRFSLQEKTEQVKKAKKDIQDYKNEIADLHNTMESNRVAYEKRISLIKRSKEAMEEAFKRKIANT